MVTFLVLFFGQLETSASYLERETSAEKITIRMPVGKSVWYSK